MFSNKFMVINHMNNSILFLPRPSTTNVKRIKPEIQKHIFRPFTPSKKKTPGIDTIMIARY